MGSAASKVFNKAFYKIGSTLQKPALREKARETETKQATEKVEAQKGAAEARKRKRRGGRVDQRGLLYASRLGGGGAGSGEDQTTLGSG